MYHTLSLEENVQKKPQIPKRSTTKVFVSKTYGKLVLGPKKEGVFSIGKD